VLLLAPVAVTHRTVVVGHWHDRRS
jgi:hypothetical protein